MSGTIIRGYTFGATEEVTAAKLHALIDDGTISGITADDIASGTITDDKIVSVGGNKLTGLANIPAGSGVIPKANLTSVAQKGANSDITSLTGLTTPLSTAQGGTGSSADANAANGVVILNGSGYLPALNGSLLTGITSSIVGIDSGEVSINANSNATITFSFTFATPPIVLITHEMPSSPPEHTVLWINSAPTTTSCGVHQNEGVNGSTVHWCAIGTKA